MTRLYANRLLPVMIPKAQLDPGSYYVGLCRNSTVAYWDGTQFHYWRVKFGSTFVEQIRHPEDDEEFDCFVPVAKSNGHEIVKIPEDYLKG